MLGIAGRWATNSVSLVSGQTGDQAGAGGLLVVNKTHTLPVMMINMSIKQTRENTLSPCLLHFLENLIDDWGCRINNRDEVVITDWGSDSRGGGPRPRPSSCSDSATRISIYIHYRSSLIHTTIQPMQHLNNNKRSWWRLALCVGGAALGALNAQ